MLNHILLYIAGLVIVLHSVLPHQHHDELSSTEHEIQHREARSVLDYIKLIFHEDIGEGHLEHIVLGQELDFDLSEKFSVSIDVEVVYFGYEEVLSKDNCLGDSNFTVQNFHSHPCRAQLALRGPPSV